MIKKSKVIILGAGAGGISTASRLKNAGVKDILIIDYADKHAYQPAWPLVGSGDEKKKDTVKPMKKVIPNGIDYEQQKVKFIQPVERKVHLDNGEYVMYEYLVVALGIQLDFNKIEGLEETLGKNGVCTNYLYDYLDYTYKTLKQTNDGNIIVTKPKSVIKGGVSPENSIFTFDEFVHDKKKNQPHLIFKTGKDTLFPVEKYRAYIEKHLNNKDIEYGLNQELVKVDGKNQRATFKDLVALETYEVPFSMLLVTPPMSAPDVVKQSTLSDAEGWLDVDPNTLQHVRHLNVFGIGDCTNLPTVKMGAAVRKQVPILVKNLLSQMNNRPLSSHYDGATACPVATEYGQAFIAEFGYDMKPKESMPIDQGKTNPLLYQVKKRAIPFMYWHAMLKGKG
ncbi:pyridine nucleotide-disulfide oxidoreductase [Macrococcus epidermidis]|uniref:Pyridine nucleotide-disulfide oxidoreductase n=2 Tax=Staphylococcaceae TaxID=90964 RepID=A0A327ZRS7_9STAP|nr:FAD/NAD(P)-binding oxidoreductase [Macrococcus epidermidis]RAK43758.1 pyridine nucleotide-disulfide oxidoreductase [Macrococcus epidermidis]UTH16578.1 NAD(P)/FAD-dependent oxidoreductase [Macrococcus epidermidis]